MPDLDAIHGPNESQVIPFLAVAAAVLCVPLRPCVDAVAVPALQFRLLQFPSSTAMLTTPLSASLRARRLNVNAGKSTDYAVGFLSACTVCPGFDGRKRAQPKSFPSRNLSVTRRIFERVSASRSNAYPTHSTGCPLDRYHRYTFVMHTVQRVIFHVVS